MKRFVVVILCLFLAETLGDLDWWRTATFYQIYPRSFKDSNGDGIGDLNGITEKLPYLKFLGIQAIWISPIFKSPMRDFGYDISDFYAIEPLFGQMEDFERLLTIAHDMKLKILLDFVPNHSSDQHQWFIDSANGVAEFKDYYIWHPGKPDPDDPTKKLPPSNWRSVIRGSAWTYHETRGEFYLHQFHPQQPDLNYRNPKVVQEMKKVLKFWLDKGVDGFRVDAIPNLFEVLPENGIYPDEPLSHLTDDEDSFDYLEHIHTMDLPETVEMVYEWRELMDEYTRKDGNTRAMLSEADSPIDILMTYYGNGQKNGSHIPFNFKMLMNLNNASNAIDFREKIHLWLDNLPAGCEANWVMGNHDRARIGSRFGADRIDLINILINTLPGISITYYGEEIGMTDVFVSWDDSVDPAACNSDPETYLEFSRDPARTPFQWDDSTSAGFSTNPKTWLPVSPLYKDVNVGKERSAQRSHLKVYKQLLRLRTTQTLKRGSIETKTEGENVLIITRRLPGFDTFFTIVNIGSEREAVDVRGLFSGRLTVQIASVASERQSGKTLRSPTLWLEPHEALILKGHHDFF
ncbi:maltase A3-like [Phlebotomus argentipes]|uniref:maltase A3-like n=1 Tax=Phlebotomus argentipes TaxID=94469 RepID=UPI002892B20B|nr:maltase A3-like [Phlebotomus argentipes]